MKENDTQFQAKTPDFNTEAAKKIAELFPEVAPDGHIDVGALEDLLSPDLENEENNEKYEFTWRGKKEAKRIANAPTRNTTLIPVKEKSKNWDSTKNVYIEGDNLEALKLLQKAYSERIKMIYIDPPYNTGHDFVYKDNFHDSYQNYLEETGQLDEEGNANTTNKESNGRYHTDWLNMMYPRLKLARNLLTKDGVIFISIDDNERDRLKFICNEIFGEPNFQADFIWKSTAGSNTGSSIKTVTEYVVCYSKNDKYFEAAGIKPTDYDKYKLKDKFVNRRGKYLLNKLDRRMTPLHYSESLNYPIQMPDGSSIYPGGKDKQDNWNWRWSKQKLQWGIDNDFIVIKKGKKGWSVYFKQYQKVDNNDEPTVRTLPPQNLLVDLDGVSSAQGTKAITDLFNDDKVFDYPKPINLLKYLIKINAEKDITILDFFSGTGSTAQAIMEQNAEDGGHRKYIMVQLPEKTSDDSVAYKDGYKTIADLGEERIRRAGEKIQKEHSNANIDTGFKVFKLQKSTIKQWDDNPEMFQQQLEMIHSPFTQESTNDQRALEIAIKEGIDLSTSPIVQENNYHFVTDTKEVFVILGNYSENLLDALDKERKLANATVVLKEMDSGSEIKFNLIEKLKQEPGLNDHFVLEWL